MGVGKQARTASHPIFVPLGFSYSVPGRIPLFRMVRTWRDIRACGAFSSTLQAITNLSGEAINHREAGPLERHGLRSLSGTMMN